MWHSDLIMLQTGNTSVLFATIAVVLGCCYAFLQYVKNGKPHKLPPCPIRPWPLVGNIFSISDDIRAQFKIWHKQCGDFFSIYFGNTLVVVVNGYSAIKDVFVHKGAITSDRPEMFMNEVTGMKDTGVAFTSGAVWKEHRSTTLQILREFGMGTNSLARRVEEEASCYIDSLIEHKGEAIDIQHYTHVSVSNVICSIIVGRRFSPDDPRFKTTMESLMRVAESSKGATAINFLPFLKYLPGDFFKAKKIEQNITKVKNLLEEVVSDVERGANTASENDSSSNYIFSYRRKQQEKTQAGKTTYLDDANLIKTIIDLFAAGTETVSSTIAWCVIFVLNTPEVQTKIHEELDRELGQGKQPTIEDQARLPYIGAVIKETQRLGSVVPFSLMHKTRDEITIGDFVLPKGTIVIPNLDSVLHDAKTWGADAEKFNPGRFLDKDGSLISREEFIPFAIGPRFCVGETLAKIELFLFISSMFQRFQFKPTDSQNPPSLKANIGITSVPMPFEVICVDRLQNKKH